MAKRDPLVPLGVGVVLGGSALWLLIELWPLLVVGGGLAMVAVGLKKSKEERDNATMG